MQQLLPRTGRFSTCPKIWPITNLLTFQKKREFTKPNNYFNNKTEKCKYYKKNKLWFYTPLSIKDYLYTRIFSNFITSVGTQKRSVKQLNRQIVWPLRSQQLSTHNLGLKYQAAIITYLTQLSMVFLSHQLLQYSDMKKCFITQCLSIKRSHLHDLKQTDVI